MQSLPIGPDSYLRTASKLVTFDAVPKQVTFGIAPNVDWIVLIVLATVEIHVKSPF